MHDRLIVVHHLTRKGREQEGTLYDKLVQELAAMDKKSIRIKTLLGFVETIMKGEYFLSFDIYRGYHKCFLQLLMPNWFLLKFMGQKYRCIEVPIGWGLDQW